MSKRINESGGMCINVLGLSRPHASLNARRAPVRRMRRLVLLSLVLLAPRLARSQAYDLADDARRFGQADTFVRPPDPLPAPRPDPDNAQDDDTSGALEEPSTTPQPDTTTPRLSVAIAPGVLATARGPPIVLGAPPANATTDYTVPGGFTVRVPAGAWLWDERRAAPVLLVVTVLDLPTPFLLGDLFATSPAAVALAPSGRRPRVPLQLRMPAAEGRRYLLTPDGAAPCNASAGGWVAVPRLGVVFSGTELHLGQASTPARAPTTPSPLPPPDDRPPPPSPPADPAVPATLGAIGGVLGVWALLVGAWRYHLLHRPSKRRVAPRVYGDAVFAVA